MKRCIAKIKITFDLPVEVDENLNYYKDAAQKKAEKIIEAITPDQILPDADTANFEAEVEGVRLKL